MHDERMYERPFRPFKESRSHGMCNDGDGDGEQDNGDDDDDDDDNFFSSVGPSKIKCF